MKEISPEELSINPVALFKNKWAALTAGNDADGYNAMTIAWGSIGTLWEKGVRSKMLPVCNVYVRPSRFTHHLMKENDMFTLSFMDMSHRKSIAMLGVKSGHDDPEKIIHAGLNLIREDRYAYMDDSDLVIVCRKICDQPIEAEHILDPEIIAGDYKGETDNIHQVFVGEIVRILIKED